MDEDLRPEGRHGADDRGEGADDAGITQAAPGRQDGEERERVADASDTLLLQVAPGRDRGEVGDEADGRLALLPVARDEAEAAQLEIWKAHHEHHRQDGASGEREAGEAPAIEPAPPAAEGDRQVRAVGEGGEVGQVGRAERLKQQRAGKERRVARPGRGEPALGEQHRKR